MQALGKGEWAPYFSRSCSLSLAFAGGSGLGSCYLGNRKRKGEGGGACAPRPFCNQTIEVWYDLSGLIFLLFATLILWSLRPHTGSRGSLRPLLWPQWALRRDKPGENDL